MAVGRVLGTALAFTLLACGGGAASDDSQQSSSEGALVGGWTRVLKCTEGNSSVVIDADGGERRHIQVVVAGGAATYFASQFHQGTQPIINGKGEVIGDSRINNPLNNASDFHGESVNIPAARMEAKREGNGLRVIVYTDQIDSWCDGNTNGGECPPTQAHEAYRRDDIANWYFPDCS